MGCNPPGGKAEGRAPDWSAPIQPAPANGPISAFPIASPGAKFCSGRAALLRMSFKVLLRSIVFLLILFVMLYVGMNNTESISFSFPIAFSKSIREPAALVFFGVFAVGVLGGTLLHAGGGRKSGTKPK